MKYPVREERFDFATGKVGMVDVDIVEDMKQDIVSMLAMVTQCETSVEINRKDLSREVAGVEHWIAYGEFSSGEAAGMVSFSWTIKKKDPQYYDVNSVAFDLNQLGLHRVLYRTKEELLAAFEREFKLFLDSMQLIPKRFPDIMCRIEELCSIARPEKMERAETLKAETFHLLGELTSKEMLQNYANSTRR